MHFFHKIPAPIHRFFQLFFITCFGTFIGFSCAFSPPLYSKTPTTSASHVKTTNTHLPSGQTSRQVLDESRKKKSALLSRQFQQKQQIKAIEQHKHQAEQKAGQDKIKARQAQTSAQSATKTLKKTENSLTDLQDQITALEQKKAKLQNDMAKNIQALTPYLPIIIRLSLYPDDTLLASPLPPEKSVSAILALNGLSRYIEQLSKTIQEQSQTIKALEAELHEKQEHLSALKQQQYQQKIILDKKALQAKKQEERSQTIAEQAARDVENATRQASSLQDAIIAIEKIQAAAQKQLATEIEQARKNKEIQKEAAARERAKSLQANNGSGITLRKGVSSPFSKPATVHYGDTTETGKASGITYPMPASAPVSSPCNGHIDFSGSFRSYGNMIILNCGRGYRFVFAGLGTLSVNTGASIGRKQNMGVMPNTPASLFIQLRNGQKIINPAPFL